MNESAIVMENLGKKFEDTTAVDDLNLQISKGELFGLLGPNGAGKTTTINILCGLTKPTKGTAKVGGYDVQKETAKVKELIGVCPQETAIYGLPDGRRERGPLRKPPHNEQNTLKARRVMLLEKMGLTSDAKEGRRSTAAA